MSIATILSLIAIVCSVISPFITALINNRHDTKVRKLEHKNERYNTNFLHQRELVEKFLSAAGLHLTRRDAETFHAYSESYYTLLYQLPDQLRPSAELVDRLIRKKEFDAACDALSVFAKSLDQIEDKYQ